MPVLKTIKNARKLIIGLVGLTVLLLGIAMAFLPGPAVIVIPIGLGILATEFVWAKSLLEKLKQRLTNNVSDA
jgi:uncharacterized protein (TIGR02611 family)